MKIQIDKAFAPKTVGDLPSGALFDLDGVPYIKVDNDTVIGVDHSGMWIGEFRDVKVVEFTEYHGLVRVVRDQ